MSKEPAENGALFTDFIFFVIIAGAIVGILGMYAFLIVPPSEVGVEDLQVQLSEDEQIPIQEDGNTVLFVEDGDKLKITDKEGTDLTRYARFEAQSEDPKIQVNNQGEISIDKDSCTVEYVNVDSPLFLKQLPVPQNFVQEEYTMSYGQEEVDITFSCDFEYLFQSSK